mmetsp:Transcript_23530/g.53643  ORF Transcript_23530/g.53643 Transcript_23530/m.53643 type:complete len:263 (+) Transcript_23530:160-948(+)
MRYRHWTGIRCDVHHQHRYGFGLVHLQLLHGGSGVGAPKAAGGYHLLRSAQQHARWLQREMCVGEPVLEAELEDSLVLPIVVRKTMRFPIHQRGSNAHVEAVGPHLSVARHAIENVVSRSLQCVLEHVVTAVHSKQIHPWKLGGKVNVALRKPHRRLLTVGAEHATNYTLARLDGTQLCHILVVLGNLECHVFGQVHLAGMHELLNIFVAIVLPGHNLHIALQAGQDGILILNCRRQKDNLVSKLSWGVPEQKLPTIRVNTD